MELSRELREEAWASADQDAEQVAAVSWAQLFVATVAAVTPDLVVSWRGGDVTATSRHANYSPAVGDRVECALHADGQLIIHDRLV